MSEKRHDLLAVSLRRHILTVLGDIADKEIRMAEHHEILFMLLLAIAEQLLARNLEQLDCHPSRVANAVELRIGIAVGQPDQRLPGLARLAEHTLSQRLRQFR